MDRGIVAVGFLAGVGTLILVVCAIFEKYLDKQIDKLFKNRGQKWIKKT